MAYVFYTDAIAPIFGAPSDHNTTTQLTVATTETAGFKYEQNGVGFGAGVLTGTVTVKGIVQAGVIVLLFDEATSQFINATTTDAGGVYTFTGLPTTRDFFMVYKEPSGLWEYRVSSRRTPE